MSGSSEGTGTPEVSIIVESYNVAEGSSPARLALSLRAALRTAAECDAEVLLADSSGDPEVPAILVDDLSAVRWVDATGHPYDEAKGLAASQARGDYILFLDGDVIPDDAEWAIAHVSVLRNGAVATTGFTHYEGGYLQELCTVMDFGFLLPVEDRDARCYTSNNAGFRADVLLGECPIPEGPLRTHCYEHADLLRRRGTPVRLVPAATAAHEKQPFWDERVRRGFDQVGVCWTNKSLPESRLLKLGPLAAPLFYARDILFDWRRILRSRRDVGWGPLKAAAALVLMPVLRLPDLVGMVRALVTPPRARVAAPATRTDPSR